MRRGYGRLRERATGSQSSAAIAPTMSPITAPTSAELRRFRTDVFADEAAVTTDGDSTHREMHDEAGASDHREQQETQRDHVVGQLRQHQAEEIQRHHGIQLTLAMLA